MDLVEWESNGFLSGRRRVPVSVLHDYNQILALIREAAPGLGPALPQELPIPAPPKPGVPDPVEPIRYRDFHHHCRQVVRLLK